MPCRIYLRWDQSSSQRSLYSIPHQAKIFAPIWLKTALQLLAQRLSGITFEVYDNPVSTPLQPLEKILITDNFNNHSLNILQRIARNEPFNTSGRINYGLYPDIKDPSVIYSIRDLVKQCVIVGIDDCSSYGGYPSGASKGQDQQKVYICDLAALQFQQNYNTGRHILIQEEQDVEKGILDDFIFLEVVGEPKKSYDEVFAMDHNEMVKRYKSHDGFQNPCFIDTLAYRKFVANDVILTGVALAKMAFEKGDKLNFKFLKYGTGFFAGAFRKELEGLILAGVIDGLERLFRSGNTNVLETIKRVELPFFNQDPVSLKRIKRLKREYKIDIVLSMNDALWKDPNVNLTVATTNCGDPHTACGNEMGYNSVDAAISENIKSKGNILCPNINLEMGEEYIDLNAGTPTPTPPTETKGAWPVVATSAEPHISREMDEKSDITEKGKSGETAATETKTGDGEASEANLQGVELCNDNVESSNAQKPRSKY